MNLTIICAGAFAVLAIVSARPQNVDAGCIFGGNEYRCDGHQRAKECNVLKYCEKCVWPKHKDPSCNDAKNYTDPSWPQLIPIEHPIGYSVQ